MLDTENLSRLCILSNAFTHGTPKSPIFSSRATTFWTGTRVLVSAGASVQSAPLTWNFKPGHQDTWVDYQADRAPLLFIAGEKDHIMPPSVNRSNAKHYKHSPALTEYH